TPRQASNARDSNAFLALTARSASALTVRDTVVLITPPATTMKASTTSAGRGPLAFWMPPMATETTTPPSAYQKSDHAYACDRMRGGTMDETSVVYAGRNP